MLKVFRYELRRIFDKRLTLIITCTLPLLTLAILSVSLFPVLGTGNGLSELNIGLVNEDPTTETILVIRHLTTAPSVDDFVTVVDIDTLEEALAQLETHAVSAVVHVPPNLQQTLFEGGYGELTFYAGEQHQQIINLLYMLLKAGLRSVNQAQIAVNFIYRGMRTMGYEYNPAAEQYNETALRLGGEILGRSRVFVDAEQISPVGEFINVEYYTLSIMVLTLCFGALPICMMFNADLGSGVLLRGIPCRSHTQYAVTRVGAGAVFSLVQFSVMLLALLSLIGGFHLFSGSVGLVLLTALLAALYFSTVALALGSVSNSSTGTVWVAFTVTLVACFMAGVFIPRGALPRQLTFVAEFTGLPAISRLLAAAVFDIRQGRVAVNSAIVLGISVLAFALVNFKLSRRYIGR